MDLSKITWRLAEISTILLYVVLIGFGYIFRAPWLGWGLFAALMALHIAGMKKAKEIGRSKGLSERRSVLMNLLFGFTWWLPVKRGIFDK